MPSNDRRSSELDERRSATQNVYRNVNSVVNFRQARASHKPKQLKEMKMASSRSPFVQRLTKIKELAGITGRDIAQLLDTTPETISRWSTGRVEPQRDRLQRVLELEFFLTELSEFYSPEEARLWLFAPHKLLNGDSPAQRIQSDQAQDVFALIDQLRSGAYV